MQSKSITELKCFNYGHFLDFYFHRMGDTPLTQIMQCLSIAIQNPREFVYPVLTGQAFLVSSAHREGDHACALKTCGSTRILWAFESHGLNALHILGLNKNLVGAPVLFAFQVFITIPTA